ncbi:MAG: hypothetical protein KC503_29355 [Myxococcales bacterium]|nr:hypothetical protein [Myxococcales bacterium]
MIVPRGLREGAAVFVFVHGHRTSADEVMRRSALARSFLQSRVNALLVVPDSPRDRSEPLRWPQLADLLSVAARGAGVDSPPDGPIIVVAHSGGYRTVARWTRHRRLRQIILLDGLYGAVGTFDHWLRASRAHRLVAFGAGTHARALRWARSVRGAAIMARPPRGPRELDWNTRHAPLLVLHARTTHAALGRARAVFDLAIALGQLEPLDAPRAWSR